MLPNHSPCRSSRCPTGGTGETEYMVDELEEQFAALKNKVRELREYL